MIPLILGAAAKKQIGLSCLGENSKKQCRLLPDTLPRRDTSSTAACRAVEGVALELTVAHRIPYESNPKQVYCPLFDEGTKKPVTKWHLISTHKYTHTESRKGRPSPCFSPFAYFPISHNTNQTAKLPRAPNKSAILRAHSRTPWQHQPSEAFGTLALFCTQTHEPQSLPCQKRLLH